MFGNPELEYVYTVELGKLVKLRVETYNPESFTFTAVKANRKIRGNLEDSDIFFKTPEEAVAQAYAELQEIAAECRQEVLDALATYKAAREAAACSIQDLVFRLVAIYD